MLQDYFKHMWFIRSYKSLFKNTNCKTGTNLSSYYADRWQHFSSKRLFNSPLIFLGLLSPHYNVCKENTLGLDKPRWESLTKCPTKHFAEPQLWHMYFSLKRIMLLEDLPLLCFGHWGINSWTRNAMTVVREVCKPDNKYKGYQCFKVHAYSGQRALSHGVLCFILLMETELIKLIQIFQFVLHLYI